MLVLSSRVREKIILPEVRTTIEVVSIHPGSVRLGIDAPQEVRILRESIPDRVAEWGPAPEPAGRPPNFLRVNEMVDRRLEIARRGLTELRRQLASGQREDAQTILDKLDEDLHLLRARLRRETAQAAPRQLAGCEGALS
jgi:carbon storage regulator CsrA